LKVSAEKMCNTSVNAMIDVIALYLDYDKGKEVSTETHKVLWNGSDVDPVSSIKNLILEEYMEGETNGWSDFTANYQKLKNTRYIILIFLFFSWVGDEGETEKKMG
jgi:plasmid replication initiation protein